MFRVIILVFALLAGGSAAWLVLATRTPAPVAAAPEAQPVAAPVIEVLVAAVALEPGLVVSADKLRWQPWPEGALAPVYITRAARPDAMEKLTGATVRTRIIASEPVQDEKFGAARSGALSALLPTGRRAVAVRITAENTAGGFILPTDRVDVLHTAAEASGGDDKRQVSRIILRNVVVMAIDQAMGAAEADPEKKQVATVGKTATLQLTPAQTEIVAAAEASGTLSLALRSASDNAEFPDIAPAFKTIRIIRGSKVENVRIPAPQGTSAKAGANAAGT